MRYYIRPEDLVQSADELYSDAEIARLNELLEEAFSGTGSSVEVREDADYEGQRPGAAYLPVGVMAPDDVEARIVECLDRLCYDEPGA